MAGVEERTVGPGALEGSEAVDGGAKRNEGGFVSVFAALPSEGAVNVIVGTGLQAAAAAAAASFSFSFFSLSAFSCSSFSFSAFSSSFFRLTSLIRIIAFASKSCFSHLESCLPPGLPGVPSATTGDARLPGRMLTPVHAEEMRAMEAMRLPGA